MRRKLDQLDTPAGERWAAAYKKGVGRLAREICEGRVDLAARPSVVDLDLQAHGASSRFDSLHGGLRGPHVGWIDQKVQMTGCGQQLAQEFQSLGDQLDYEKIN